jgi:hypothetical protein
LKKVVGQRRVAANPADIAPERGRNPEVELLELVPLDRVVF